MTDKKIAVLATGALGSCIGADFTMAGYDVTLIDQWPAHIKAMKTHGLRGTKAHEFQIRVEAIHLCELANLKPQFDIVFLTSKAIDSRWLAQLIEPYLKSDGVLVSAQNSMCDEWIAPIVGAGRDIGCVVELSSEVFEPGLVQRDTDHNTTRFILGELDGKITPRLKEMVQIMSVVGRIETSANIWGAKWTKLLFNTMNSSLGAISGIKSAEMIQDSRNVDFAIKMGKEAIKVGMALGYSMELFGMTAADFISAADDTLRKLLFKINSDIGSDQHTAVEQDLMKGRTSEVSEYLNGLVARKGRENNIPTPYNDALISVVKQVEQGKLKREPATLEMVLAQPHV